MKLRDSAAIHAAIAKLGVLQRQFEEAYKKVPELGHVVVQRGEDGTYPILQDGLECACSRHPGLLTRWEAGMYRGPEERGYPTKHWLRFFDSGKVDACAALHLMDEFDDLASRAGAIAATLDDTILPVSKADLWVTSPTEYWVLLLHHVHPPKRWTLAYPKTKTIPRTGEESEQRPAKKGEPYFCWLSNLYLESALACGELVSRAQSQDQLATVALPTDGDLAHLLREIVQARKVTDRRPEGYLREIMNRASGWQALLDPGSKAAPLPNGRGWECKTSLTPVDRRSHYLRAGGAILCRLLTDHQIHGDENEKLLEIADVLDGGGKYSEPAKAQQPGEPNAAAPKSTKRSATVDKAAMSKKAKALAALADHPGWTDEQIAHAAGCHVKSLYRWNEYTRARELLRQGRDNIPRGTKDGGTGDVEAWDEKETDDDGE